MPQATMLPPEDNGLPTTVHQVLEQIDDRRRSRLNYINRAQAGRVTAYLTTPRPPEPLDDRLERAEHAAGEDDAGPAAPRPRPAAPVGDSWYSLERARQAVRSGALLQTTIAASEDIANLSLADELRTPISMRLLAGGIRSIPSSPVMDVEVARYSMWRVHATVRDMYVQALAVTGATAHSAAPPAHQGVLRLETMTKAALGSAGRDQLLTLVQLYQVEHDARADRWEAQPRTWCLNQLCYSKRSEDDIIFEDLGASLAQYAFEAHAETTQEPGASEANKLRRAVERYNHLGSGPADVRQRFINDMDATNQAQPGRLAWAMNPFNWSESPPRIQAQGNFFSNAALLRAECKAGDQLKSIKRAVDGFAGLARHKDEANEFTFKQIADAMRAIPISPTMLEVAAMDARFYIHAAVRKLYAEARAALQGRLEVCAPVPPRALMVPEIDDGRAPSWANINEARVTQSQLRRAPASQLAKLAALYRIEHTTRLQRRDHNTHLLCRDYTSVERFSREELQFEALGALIEQVAYEQALQPTAIDPDGI